MQFNTLVKSFFLYGVIICFTLSLFIGIATISSECKCDPEININQSPYASSLHIDQSASNSHNLAILVPFRERFEELLNFAPYISNFLKKQSVRHHIFILNQIDRLRFNRASLINVGFLHTKNNYDYIAMHDVDLIPLNDNLKYSYPKDGPLHIASPEFHPKYHYATFVGGILLIKREHFQILNGMSNKYWGWGLEDDEFYVRIKNSGLTVTRPENISTGPKDTFSHIHDRNHRKRDTEKCFNQKEVTRRRDRETGLNTTKYSIKNINELTIDNTAVTVVNIKLICDTLLTPWCDCSNN